MATITEDYVSFETAKLLKEKGFDCRCACINHPQCGMFLLGHMISNTDLKLTREYELCIDKENLFTIPTLQMAMKWLREVHNIFIVIEPHIYDHINEKNSSYVASLWQGDNYYENITSKDYPTYEEAVETALKYSLENLI